MLARRLYFLRHGQAGFAYHDDRRPLTEGGRRRLEQTALYLATLDPPCGAIITSPLLRAVETAEIMAEKLDLVDRIIVDERLRSGCRLSDLMAILADHAATHRDLMLVGHQPDLSLMIEALTGGLAMMQPGTLALVEMPAQGRGRLAWLLQPDAAAGLAPSD